MMTIVHDGSLKDMVAVFSQFKKTHEQELEQATLVVEEANSKLMKLKHSFKMFSDDFVQIEHIYMHRSKQISVDDVINICCTNWNIKLEQLSTTNRSLEIVTMKKVLVKILLDKFHQITLEEIGFILKRHHSSIINLVDGFDSFYKNEDPVLLKYLTPVKYLIDDFTPYKENLRFNNRRKTV
jgi:chromosomal replication initiation ATPase DnaA